MTDALLAVLCGVLGLAVGSFLNVVVWRVPRGESVVRPRSRCPGCGTQLQARDNVPVLSWLLLRGRCRGCAAPISARYPAVELLTAAVFVALALRFGADAALPAYLFFAAVGIALAFIDADVRRLPNALTLPAYPVGVVLLGVAAAVSAGPTPFVRALVGMAVLFAGYLALVLVYPSGMGLGDVKLAGVIGLFTAWVGWGALAVGAFAGFLFGGVAGIALMAARGAGRKTAIPFGPFMFAGALVAVLVGPHIADAYAGLALG